MELNKNIDEIVFADVRLLVEVGDLREWHYVEVTCQACGHVGRIYSTRLWKLCPMESRITDLVRRFKCQSCEAKGRLTWNIRKINRNA